MNSRIQDLASQINMSCDEFVGEMRKHAVAVSPPHSRSGEAAMQDFNEFEDNDILLSNLRKAADVLRLEPPCCCPVSNIRLQDGAQWRTLIPAFRSMRP